MRSVVHQGAVTYKSLRHPLRACRPGATFKHLLPASYQKPARQGYCYCVAVMADSAPGSSGQGRRILLWFRNDLRLHDNSIVHEAVQRVKSKEFTEVVPVYCFDPRFYKKSSWGNLKTGAFRAKFLLESVADLKQSLQNIGSDLLVAVGKPEDVIAGLVKDVTSPPLVLTQEECTSEEIKVDAQVSRALKPVGGNLVKMWGHTMFHLDDLQGPKGPFSTAQGVRAMPDVFTPFREKVEKGCSVRKEVPNPKPGELPFPSSGLAGPWGPVPQWNQLPWPTGEVPELPMSHPNAVLSFKGGETVALARLKYYLWDSDLLSTYFDTRNGMLGGDYSTKFAPWLAAGCLSPRTIYHQIKKYESQRVANKSTYWVIFELIWRDFFRFFAVKHGNKIFFEEGTCGKRLPWATDPELWQRWLQGRTGMPLVDANMRELAATGFMSNRGRQNVASYLVLDMGVDWRRGADYFESLLLDYDVCSNWGNWVAAAGLTGGRLNLFNITKQSKDYDLNGDYIRTWVPQLKNVPASRIHEPWLMSKDEQTKYGVQIGTDYPSPLPAARLGRPWSRGQQPHNSGGWGGNGGSSNGTSSYSRGGGRGGWSIGGAGSGGRGGVRSSSSSRPGTGQQYKRSEFERYGM